LDWRFRMWERHHEEHEGHEGAYLPPCFVSFVVRFAISDCGFGRLERTIRRLLRMMREAPLPLRGWVPILPGGLPS
jgi:hypothetical protein